MSTAPLARPQIAEVLQVVLQRLSGPDDWDLRTLCSLLLVSTACRTAVLNSGASCSLSPQHFRPSNSRKGVSMQRIMGFAAWLPNHASLVTSLELYAPESQADAAMAEQVLTMAVKLCAAQQQEQQQQQQQQHQAAPALTPSGLLRPLTGLRLRSLTGNVLLQPAALAALGSCSHLTNLKWWQLPSAPSAGMLRALGQLTGLSTLHFQVPRGTEPGSVSEGLAASLAHMQKLQQLHCVGNGVLTLSTMCQLPASLTCLGVPVKPRQPAEAQMLDLGHLTALESLDLVLYSDELLPVVMPASLTMLDLVGGCLDMAPGLSNLVHLSMRVDFAERCLLQHVHAMPQLRMLALGLGKWKRVTVERAQAVATGLAQATQVSRLELVRDWWRSANNQSVPRDSELLLCDSLQQLRNLRVLHCEGICLQPRDVLCWTALSALTGLGLVRCKGVTDTAAAALGCKLTGLGFFAVEDCGLSSPVLWPALACCSGLQELVLGGNALPLVDETLMLLTSLTQLDTLVLPKSAATGPSATAVQHFKAAMPQLEQLTWE